MILIWLLFYIEFIDLFLLAFYSMLFIFVWIVVAGKFVAIFTRGDFYVSDYFISSSLIDSLLALLCMLFRFIWNIVAGMLLAVYTRSDYFVCSWNDHLYMSRSLIDSNFYFFSFTLCTVPFRYIKNYVIIVLLLWTRKK